MKKYEFHPLCELFPQMSDAEIEDLGADIKKRGLRHSIKTFGGKILDGRNRYLACERVKFKPHFEEFKGEDALAFVLSENLHRRHLNDSQRAMLAAEIAKLEAGQKQADGVTADAAATSLNVSKRLVQTAKKVKANATKPLQKMVRDGEASVSAAAAVSELPRDTQRQIVRKGPDAVKTAASNLRRPASETRDNSAAYLTTRPPAGTLPPKRTSAAVKSDTLEAVTDADSAIARLEAIYEREKAWFNVVPLRTPRAILDKLIEGVRE